MLQGNRRLVSVIIPTYNCADYVLDAITSVMAQTYRETEIIVVDDGSSDGTCRLLEPMAAEKKIRYLYQSNRGTGVARNTGIRRAKGFYVAFLDAGDLWVNDKLLCSVDFLERKNFDWICTGLIKTEMDGTMLEKRKIKEGSYGYNQASGMLYNLKKGLFSHAYSLPVHGPTMVLKKRCFEKAGYFDETIRIFGDTDLAIRFEDCGFKGGYLDEMLTIHRFSENGKVKSNLKEGLLQHYLVAKKHAVKLGLDDRRTRKDYGNILWELSVRFYINRVWFYAAWFALKSFFWYPDALKAVKIRKYLLKAV